MTQKTIRKEKEISRKDVCYFCDYGPNGYDGCPKSDIQEERIIDGFCGFADIDGCQVRITKDNIIVHNVYNPNVQRTNHLEDVNVPKDNLLRLKNTLNKVPVEYRKKETPSPGVLSEIFEGLEANV